MQNNKEHHIKDIVYFMHDNKPAKGIIIGECKQIQSQLNIDNDEELIQCLHSDYIRKEHTVDETNIFNKVVIINSNDKDNKYTSINDWLNGNDLFESANDLFCSLLETKL